MLPESLSSLPPVIQLLAGLVFITVGAELVLRGAARVASMLGIKPLVIGLTVVAMGTSAPELAVGINASLDGRGNLAVGNIAGTNLVNILLILGLSAAIRPLPLHMASIKLDVPVMIAAAVALFFMAWDGSLSRIEGAILVGAAVVYVVLLLRVSRRENAETRRDFEEEYGASAFAQTGAAAAIVRSALLLILGIGLTVASAELIVSGAVSIAEKLGVSEAIIGLTIVAIGTSAPELVTTLLATLKDDRDVAIGNLIGSSISNILIILGLTCIVAGEIDVTEDILWIDIPLAAAVAIACLPVFRTGQRVSRVEGMAFVGAYLVYLAVLVLLRVSPPEANTRVDAQHRYAHMADCDVRGVAHT